MDPKFLIILSVILVALSCFQSVEANKHIKKENDENSERYWIPSLVTAPVAALIAAIIALVVAYFSI